MFYTRAYPSYQWWIFGGEVIYTRAYFIHRWHFLSGWCLALRHSQFTSSLGLWWIKSCRMTLHWGHSHSRGHFLLEIQSPYSIFYIVTHSTHWWLIFEMMVYFETQLLHRLYMLRHSSLIGYGLRFILEHSHFRWFILGHSHFIHTHRAWGFLFVWIMLRCFHC